MPPRISSFIIYLLSVLFFLCFSSVVHAQTEAEPADNFQLQVYLTEEQALTLIFPDCDRILTDELILTAEEKGNLEKLLNRRLFEDGFKVYAGEKDGVIQGYAIVTEEIGKFHPFTFIVGVKLDGEINNIAVLVYRESRGGEIVKKRFLYQFIGKSFKDPIRINKDIINITGATMSVQCVCAGIRKVLSVINEYYLSGKRNASNFKIAENYTKVAKREESLIETNRHTGVKGRDADELKLFKQTRMIMGTFAEISVYSSDEKNTGKAIDAALDEIERMDSIMSNYKNKSELSILNKTAAKSPVQCSKELLDVIEQSLYYSKLSEGAFDITVSPIVALWGFFDEKVRIPSGKDIEKLLPAVSHENIVINKDDNQGIGTVFFKNTKTQIDLGGIGKGYAVDKALNVIKKLGIYNACINLGGNIYVLGAPDGKDAWRIGIQHPRNKDEILGYLELINEATATSGDYERFIEIKGKRYSHIINPRTGQPVSGTIAVVIVAPTGTAVDALSTSVFVLGHERGLKLISKIPDADAMIAYEGKDGKIMIDMTPGFEKKFKKLNNKGESNVKWHVVSPDK